MKPLTVIFITDDLSVKYNFITSAQDDLTRKLPIVLCKNTHIAMEQKFKFFLLAIAQIGALGKQLA